jgi:hypothetical protein
MKKIKPYVAKLIQQNLIYLSGAVLLLVLIVVVIKTGVDRIQKVDAGNKILTSEVTELRTKFNLLNTVVPSSEQLDSDILLLNSLIPEAEDYFSIIYALETLSKKTGFIITSYTVNMKSSTKEQLKLSITGVGDTTSFMNFLENYNFAGGRLITSDKIELNPQESSAIRVDLTFYNKKVALNFSGELEINPKTIEEIALLRNKVDFSFKETGPAEEVDYSYPKKNNPF